MITSVQQRRFFLVFVLLLISYHDSRATTTIPKQQQQHQHQQQQQLLLLLVQKNNETTTEQPPKENQNRSSSSSSSLSSVFGIDCTFPIHYPTLRNCHDPTTTKSTRTTTATTNSSVTTSTPFDSMLLQKNNNNVYQTFYNDTFLHGCFKKYGTKYGTWCLEYETERFMMNLHQPSTILNYTKHGYRVVPIPNQLLYQPIYEYYNNTIQVTMTKEKLKQDDTMTSHHSLSTFSGILEDEIWNIGDTSINHWLAPTYLIDLNRIIQQQTQQHHVPKKGKVTTTSTKEEETTTTSREYQYQQRRQQKVIQRQQIQHQQYLHSMKELIYRITKHKMELWTGIIQKPMKIEGIRQYTKHAIVSPHVTPIPYMNTCIIHISQHNNHNHNHQNHKQNNKYGSASASSTFVEEPWPIELINRHGMAVNITLQPGEMLLLESGTMIHGRPYPLQSDFYSELYVYFEPTGQPVATTTPTSTNSHRTTTTSSTRSTSSYSQDPYHYNPPYIVRDYNTHYKLNTKYDDPEEEDEEEVDEDDDKDHKESSSSSRISKSHLFDTKVGMSWNDNTGDPEPSQFVPAIKQQQQQQDHHTLTYQHHHAVTNPHQQHHHQMMMTMMDTAMNAVTTTPAHIAASMGDIDGITKMGIMNRVLLTRKDYNGWQPIHEAARGGHISILRIFIEQYHVNVDTPTGISPHLFDEYDDNEYHNNNNNNNNPNKKQQMNHYYDDDHHQQQQHGKHVVDTPLSIAIRFHGKDHEIVWYLLSMGATMRTTTTPLENGEKQEEDRHGRNMYRQEL